ncbi:NACHT, LRR and PYD domains-containing protein 12-like isoform X2 [Alosa sapidissima]|nr:NACHT, LRR and PYD domains-containing protein 12-like isoform X2 [Alosa sapidissima]XP_041939885.1 NACHT, LRR and PYD domains-containing protein 12-like isoform X2 [Alosa sapidissima]
MASCLTLLLSTLDDLTSRELKKFRLYLSEGILEGFARLPRGKLQEDSDATDIASRMTEMYGGDISLKITLHILREIKHNELAARLEGELKRTQTNSQGLLSQLDGSETHESLKHENTIKQKISEQNKLRLRRKFEKLFEGTEERENQRYLNDIYTELYIVDEESERVNTQHEIWHIQSGMGESNELMIKCNDIFHCSPGHRHIRTVITKGVAGVGKTVTVQKFILDWAEGRTNQDIDLIFVLPFRELNLVIHDQYTLLKLLFDFHPELRDVVDEKLYDESKIVFIFDGLDESKLPLNFLENKNFSDVQETTSVDILITNLIRENLLPFARIWITSRPAAASQIPSEYVDRWTEIKGFNSQQMEEYFKNKIKNPTEADRVVTQIKKSRPVHVMCQIPIFCWIFALVLQKVLSQDCDGKIPQTLTEIFIHFLIIQMNRKNQKYDRTDRDQKKLWESNKYVILKYAELGFKQLDKGNIVFTEEDLTNCGIDFNEDLEKSGICTEIFIEEVLMQKKRFFCFIHLSFQEFLAAVFVLHSLACGNLKSLQHHHIYGEKLHHILGSVVDKSLRCQNGHLDLFLRFLLGISMESNQKLLQGLVMLPESSSESIDMTIKFIKDKLSTGFYSAERCMNLLLCLLEMRDNSLEREIQQYVTSGQMLSPDQCSVLAYMLLIAENIQDEFDLGKYNTTNEGRNRLIIALGAYRKARLVCCDLTKASCIHIKSALQAEKSPLRELDLRGNQLHRDGVQLLFDGLTHKNCKLEALRLSGCDFTHTSCNTLASALCLQHSHLKELDLSNNPLKSIGLKDLTTALIHSNCKLEKLGLAHCNLTYGSCRILASVLESANSRLKQLDLTNNDLQDYGVIVLANAMSHQNCRLETLRLSGCLVSKRGCESLASTLRSNPSNLTELDLSYNHPGVLSRLLEEKDCKLEKLKLDHNQKHWLKAGLSKYACKLKFDENTAHPYLSLSKANRKVIRLQEKRSYPDHPDRFEEFVQVLCTEGLTGRCYWEVEVTGIVSVGMVCKSISRKVGESKIGCNNRSWSEKFQTLHPCRKHTSLYSLMSSKMRVAVYLDSAAGMLSFYTINGHDLRHVRTVYSEFSEPLYPGFELLYHEIHESSVSLL